MMLSRLYGFFILARSGNRRMKNLASSTSASGNHCVQSRHSKVASLKHQHTLVPWFSKGEGYFCFHSLKKHIPTPHTQRFGVLVNGLEIRGENYGKIVADLANEEAERHFQYRTPDNRRWVAVHDLLKENAFQIYDTLPTEYRQRFQDIRQRLIRFCWHLT